MFWWTKGIILFYSSSSISCFIVFLCHHSYVLLSLFVFALHHSLLSDLLLVGHGAAEVTSILVHFGHCCFRCPCSGETDPSPRWSQWPCTWWFSWLPVWPWSLPGQRGSQDLWPADPWGEQREIGVGSAYLQHTFDGCL